MLYFLSIKYHPIFDLISDSVSWNEHINKVHNLWTYVDYILGLRFVDIQETNAINSYVMETIEKKELSWFPSFKDNNVEDGDGGDS